MTRQCGRWGRRYHLRVPLAVVALGLTALCTGSTNPGRASVPSLTMADVPRASVSEDSPQDQVVLGMTEFGYDLVAAAEEPGENWIMSPLSIACAFAMARAGAGGETAEQLDEVFGFPEDGLHDAFNALTQSIETSDGTEGGPEGQPTVSLASGLFADGSLAVDESFLNTLASAYGVGVRSVDFSSSSAAEEINRWVSTETAGRIDRLFDQLDPETQMVIANALYLRARWAEPMTSVLENQIFTTASGETVSTELMARTTDLEYSSGDGWQAVAIPYEGQRLAMLVLLPENGSSDEERLATLSPPVVNAALDGMQPTPVDLALPRWETTSSLDLMSALTGLGVTDLSDFSGINPRLALGQAVHRATITVDENGTEAAAVTGLGMTMSAVVGDTVTFRADHPFCYMIVDLETRTPLFAGQVTTPV